MGNLFHRMSLSLDVYNVPHDQSQVIYLGQEYPRNEVMVFDPYWCLPFQIKLLRGEFLLSEILQVMTDLRL